MGEITGERRDTSDVPDSRVVISLYSIHYQFFFSENVFPKKGKSREVDIAEKGKRENREKLSCLAK